LGGLAVPAAAQTRQQAVQQANDAIDKCFEAGGSPGAGVTPDGSIAVSCQYRRSADNTVCTWDAGTSYTMHCELVAQAGTHAPLGGGTLDGAGVAQGLGAVASHADAPVPNLDAPAPHGHHNHHRRQGHKK
jgi:hypothetical protein